MYMSIHTKFKLGGKRFGVEFKQRLRGMNRDLALYQYDGNEWNHLESESPQEAHGIPPTGKLSDRQLEQWGKEKAEWYI